jgi:death on curing protein
MGGGLRDPGLPDSVLARPPNLCAYREERDPCRLAAACAMGIVQNHPWVDGNTRAAFATAIELTAEPAMATVAMLDLAAGELSEDEFAAWLRDHTAPRG